jgi:hypothetical protein
VESYFAENFYLKWRLSRLVICDMGRDGCTSPPKEGVLRIFFALKNPDGFGWV